MKKGKKGSLCLWRTALKQLGPNIKRHSPFGMYALLMIQDECLHTAWVHVSVFSRKHTMLGWRNESGLLNHFKQSKTWWKNELRQILYHCKYLHYSRLQSGHAQSIFSIRWDVHLPQSISSARPLVWQLLCPHSSWCARPRRSPSSARTSALGSWAGTWSGGPVHCEEE